MAPGSTRKAIDQFDAVLVGGGLQNGLIALAMLNADPKMRVALVERAERLGGEHIWCFHAEDIPDTARAFVDPLVEYRWDGYEVEFPNLSRRLHSSYSGFSSDRFHAVVTRCFADHPECELRLGARAAEISAHRVVLDDGQELAADLVVDARGPEVGPSVGRAGFQKFVGRELELGRPHGLARPVVMDAKVPQRDGFRFFYLLPLDERRLLVEDTCFSDSPDLDVEGTRSEIHAYAAERGFDIAHVRREETGVLPMPWRGSGPRGDRVPLLGGYRGKWLHPATGYSLPVAVGVAALVASSPDRDRRETALTELARRLRRQIRFAQRLNRLLFRWFAPDQRCGVFERFYRLPEGTIRRFYALRTTLADRARILLGRPPRGFSLRARLTAAERCS